jgi:flagellar biosynthesis/type III secretory pathway protein FliH
MQIAHLVLLLMFALPAMLDMVWLQLLLELVQHAMQIANQVILVILIIKEHVTLVANPHMLGIL